VVMFDWQSCTISSGTYSPTISSNETYMPTYIDSIYYPLILRIIDSTITNCTTNNSTYNTINRVITLPVYTSSIFSNRILFDGTRIITLPNYIDTIGSTIEDVQEDPQWPGWHNNISIPSIIQERMEAEAARRALQEQRFLENQELQRAAEKRADEARKRAREILLEHLTSEQRDMVEKNGWFVIQGGKSKKTYRIGSKAIAGNVEELDIQGKVIAKYCCHLPHIYPAHDHHLTQKLMLEWDEEEFLRKANKTNVS